MKESDIQGELGRFLNKHQNEFTETFTCEVKICKLNRFAFNQVQPHQLVGLQNSQNGLYIKLSDAFIFDLSTGKSKQGTQRPFDFVFVKTPKTYVSICFYTPRKHKVCYFMYLERYLELEEQIQQLGKKSCHEEDLEHFCAFKIDLLKKKLTFIE